MFYCSWCAEDLGWPAVTTFQSWGKCEMCRQTAACNDLPPGRLPLGTDEGRRRVGERYRRNVNFKTYVIHEEP